MDDLTDKNEKQPKVTGIGGVFFFFRKPRANSELVR